HDIHGSFRGVRGRRTGCEDRPAGSLRASDLQPLRDHSDLRDTSPAPRAPVLTLLAYWATRWAASLVLACVLLMILVRCRSSVFLLSPAGPAEFSSSCRCIRSAGRMSEASTHRSPGMNSPCEQRL